MREAFVTPVMRVLALALLFSLPLAASDVTTKFETVDVANGIVAFIASEPKSGVVNGNCVAIIGDDGVVVVDPGQMPTLARRMVAEIRKRTDKPVKVIVTTHWHWDHNLASSVFLDTWPHATFVSTEFTRRSLVDFTPGFLTFLEKAPEVAISKLKLKRSNSEDETERANLTDDIDDFTTGIPEVRKARFVAPHETFERSMTVHLGKREVRIFNPGRANTAGDAVVWVPDARVLVTGDIVVAPTPYATSSYLAEWITVLDELSKLDAAAIVPGHGAVQRDQVYMKQLRELLQSVVTQVGSAVREGLSLEETKRKVDLEKFRLQFAGDDRRRNRAFRDYFVTSAITAAWKQARGEPTTESPF